MRSWLLAVAVLATGSALVGPVALAQEAVTLDLQRVVALALERNAALQAEAERRQEVAGGVREAGADAWPQVDVIGNWNRSRTPSLLNSPDFEDFIDLFPDFVPGEQELYTVGVEVTQPIYTGGKVQAALDLAKLVVDITDAQILAVRLDTALRAAESWYRLQAARASLAAVTSQQEARRESLQVVKDRFDLGEATRLELLRAEASLAEVAPSAAEIEGLVLTETARLRALLGLGSDADVLIEPGLAVDGHGEDVEVPDEVPDAVDLLDLALATRPELRDLGLQSDALERQRTVTTAEKRPQVEFSGLYGRQVRLLDNLDDDLFQNWSVTLSMSWNVFDGGRVAGQVAQIDSRKLQLDWQREELRRQIAADIEESRAALRTAVERERAAQASSEAAAEAARVAGETYRQGVALQADLLDAQDRAIAAELSATRATLERRVQLLRLKRAVGLLPTESFRSSKIALVPPFEKGGLGGISDPGESPSSSPSNSAFSKGGGSESQFTDAASTFPGDQQ